MPVAENVVVASLLVEAESANFALINPFVKFVLGVVKELNPKSLAWSALMKPLPHQE